MSTVMAALLVTLLTSCLTSAVSHQFTIVGGAAAAVVYTVAGLISPRARLHPIFLFCAATLTVLVLVSSEVNTNNMPGTIHIFSCYIATLALAVSSPDLSKFCRWVIFCNNILLTFFVLGQVLRNPSLKAWSIDNPSGAANLMAAQINMTLPFVLMKIHDSREQRRLLWILLLILNCTAVMAIMSRNGLGTMLIILTLYILFNHKSLSVFLVSSIILLMRFLDELMQIQFIHLLLIRFRIIGYKSMAPRSLIWEIAFHHIRENPWLGVGPGRPREFLEVIDIYHAHNDIIQVAMETGLPASALYTTMIGLLLTLPLFSLRRDRRTFMACLPILAYFAYSWTGCPLGLPPATLLLAICVNEARLHVAARSTEEQAQQQRNRQLHARTMLPPVPGPARLRPQL